MSKTWSKIYNNKSFFRNTYSHKIILLSKKLNWTNHKLSFELFKIMNPISNNAPLKKSFKDYLNYIKMNIKINKKSTILDYGSGNGFYLNYLSKSEKIKKLYSKDVNYYFIKLQKKIIKNCKFEIINPTKSKINEKNNSIDWIICNAVLHCLPNKNYTKKLILEMIRVAKKGIFISDIFNFKFKKKFTYAQMKRQNLNLSEYKKKYKKTPHLYFKKKDFDYLKKFGFKIKFLNMPKTFYDSQFGRFSLKILK